MTDQARSKGLLRSRGGHEDGRVTYVELFFDLVFVFAVTQLSHTLVAHLTLPGAFEAVLLLMAVWWVWVYTSWVTNWLDPGRTAVRLMLFTLMLAGLVLSTSIPKAFGDNGLVFALAYVTMQLGRSLFTLWAIGRGNSAGYRNFQRITSWMALSAVFWIMGGLAEPEARPLLWTVAVAVEYLGPSVTFWTPGLGRSSIADWDVDGSHIAERCGLFIIIALGESILVTGGTFGGLAWTPAVIAAAVTSFLGSVTMWWIYFDTGAARANRQISSSRDPGRLARLAYTYVHLPLVAGIIVTAVADELVLAHASGHTDVATAAAILGGPGLFVLGNVLFKRIVGGRLPRSHLAGLLMLALLAPFSLHLTPLTLSGLSTLVLVIVAVWERISLRHTRAALAEDDTPRGEPLVNSTH